MHVLVRNLKGQERRVSPTSYATVLLMLTQKVMSTSPENENEFDPIGLFTVLADQFISIFMGNCIYDETDESITEALDVYASFHVLETLPTLWSPIHEFKCNCSIFFGSI